jgi:hypothetical protein
MGQTIFGRARYMKNEYIILIENPERKILLRKPRNFLCRPDVGKSISVEAYGSFSYELICFTRLHDMNLLVFSYLIFTIQNVLDFYAPQLGSILCISDMLRRRDFHGFPQ